MSNVSRGTLAVMALALSGCMSVDSSLQGVDYGCVSFTLDGPATDSMASGRGIKIPEGVEITADLLNNLCRFA